MSGRPEAPAGRLPTRDRKQEFSVGAYSLLEFDDRVRILSEGGLSVTLQ